MVLSTPANTGVPGAETPMGIFPIFARDVSTTMTGRTSTAPNTTFPSRAPAILIFQSCLPIRPLLQGRE